MATFTETQVRNRAQRKTPQYKTARTVLLEEVTAGKLKTSFDIFLSHSTSDAELILGVKAVLEDFGKTVYVDWLEDPQMDRSRVTPETAELIRSRMKQSKSLIYVHTVNSTQSKWMPWELGYFDGFSGAVAILPITRLKEQGFQGQEYLGIYPYIDEAPAMGSNVNSLWIRKSLGETRSWASWMTDPRSFRKTR